MPPPNQVIIFGASGDLTRRKLIPALVRLYAEHPGEPAVQVIGVSRSKLDDDSFRKQLAAAMPAELSDTFERFASSIHYESGDASDFDSVKRLSKRLDELAEGQATGRLFYLSLKPELFPVAVQRLSGQGLLQCAAGEEHAWRRVVIEKPFGSDLKTARALNRNLQENLREEQIYRIDHYLGKETVQNLLGFRFHNAIFEPLWNRHHVECVQITVAESIGVEDGRGGYYDETGAMRDMMQNHMLQVLALVGMEPPSSLDAEAIRNQKIELLRGLRHPDAEAVRTRTVRARYGPGSVDGKQVAGYLEERGVDPKSTTETYVAVCAAIDNWRWSGVPFLLRHGKRLPQRFTEIEVQFRTPPIQLFNRPLGMVDAEYNRMLRDGSLSPARPNILKLRLQPREAIELSFGVKEPGSAMVMSPAKLDFDYREHFGKAPPDAYERLLLDALLGDQTLFLRADEIEASWRYADQILEGWRGPDAPPLLEYPAGSWGPDEANALFGSVNSRWSRG